MQTNRETARVAADLMATARAVKTRSEKATRDGDARLADMLMRRSWRYERQAESLMRLRAHIAS